ncbi:MAG: peptide deformylase [Rickettsiaceae bacterium]|nr:peptide deformylase [Rickettsiaceae bacterium]
MTNYRYTKPSLIIGPNEIFRKKAHVVDDVNDEIRAIVDDMLEIMYKEHAVGLGANMVGILKAIAVVDLQKDGKKSPYIFINPNITYKSTETQSFEEASICFPGVSAQITRPSSIEISYLDYEGKETKLEASGFLASVIQHEVDYLEGKTFFDHLSKMKRDILIKRSEKFLKSDRHHIHTEHCRH